jgi:hypothetical protein
MHGWHACMNGMLGGRARSGPCTWLARLNLPITRSLQVLLLGSAHLMSGARLVHSFWQVVHDPQLDRHRHQDFNWMYTVHSHGRRE